MSIKIRKIWCTDSKLHLSMEIFSTSSQIPPNFTTLKFKINSPFQFNAIFVHLLLLAAVSAADDASILYSEHCNDVVRDPPLLPNPNPPISDRRFLVLRRAHIGYTSNDTTTTNNVVSSLPGSLSFSSRRVYMTQNDAVFKIEAGLSLTGLNHHQPRRGLRLVHFRPPRIPVTPGDSWNFMSFSLSGFWDSVSGKLCMVGSGFGKFSSSRVVLKLDYSNSSSIFNSLVNGTLESLDGSDGGGVRHKMVSILGVNLRYYKYEMIDKEIESNGFMLLDDVAKVSMGAEDLGQKVCLYIRSSGVVELEYTSDCSRVNCNFLGGGNSHFTPNVMYFNEIECLEDGRVRFLLGFDDVGHNGYRLPFEPNVTLVTEGKWDAEKRRLNMVGCRIFNDSDEGFVGECLIRLSLRFPARWTLRDRSAVVGELWSSRSVDESGYFAKVSLASMKNKNVRAPGLRYEYTEIENARKLCQNKTIKKGRGKYPDALSSDMRFDMVVGNKKVKDLWGYSSPLYVDNRLYPSSVFARESVPTLEGKQNHSNMINVSYVLNLASSHDFKLSSEFTQIKVFDVSAEGTYDPKTGRLCMVGCMHVAVPKVGVQRNSSLDCKIRVDIRYPPLQAVSGSIVKGTIESTRDKSDRLYFEPFQIISHSIYRGQAKESIWRMDLEITMVLISKTLVCIFICLQLLHFKRHTDVRPSVSVIMLIMLTLAHMIPLLLNFEALFMVARNGVNVYFGSDGWLEVNEVLVRIATMIAFLLEFFLLQMAWSARTGDSNQKNFWISEKKVLYLSLPMYIGGGLIACLVHLSKNRYQRPSYPRFRYQQLTLWGDLKSYGGLILDGFLFPQILFNLFCDTKEKALAPSFYIGTTFVRLLPHAYDIYRCHSSTWSFNYIYANPRMDYYSTTWDIIIFFGGLLLALIVYLQQRYGGCCLLPSRFRQTVTYERVPEPSTENLELT